MHRDDEQQAPRDPASPLSKTELRAQLENDQKISPAWRMILLNELDLDDLLWPRSNDDA